MNITNWNQHKKILLARRPGFQKALDEYKLEYEIARTLIKARIDKGMTQKELASKMNTKQSVISRVENARTTPTLNFLKRLAVILESSLKVYFG